MEHGLKINKTMYNHLVLGYQRKGGSRICVAPDVRAKLHDSMNWAWWTLEALPKRRRKWGDHPDGWSLFG